MHVQAARRAHPRFSGVLCEREGEISHIDGVLAAARSGAGGVAYIDGGGGTGKSRLMTQAATMARAAGMLCLRAAGRQIERHLAYGVVIQMLAKPTRASDAGSDALASAEAAGRLIDRLSGASPAAGSDDRLATVHGLFEMLRDYALPAGADPRPLAVLVDDVSAADAASLRFLAYLGARCSDLPIVLVVAARRGEPESDPGALRSLRQTAGRSVLRLGNLAPPTVEKLVRDAIPHADAATVRGFQQATAGNPLLLVELLTDAGNASGELLTPAAGVLAAMVPAPVVWSIEARLAVVPAEAVVLARCVAVLGGATLLPVAAAAAELEASAAVRGADALAAVDILAPGVPLRFVATVVEQLLQRSVSPLERIGIQRRAAHADRLGEHELALEMSLSGQAGRARDLAALGLQKLADGERQDSDESVLATVVTALTYVDDLERVVEILADPRYRATGVTAPQARSAISGVHAWALYHRGQIEASFSLARAAHDAATAHGAMADAYRLGCTLAACHIQRGQLAEADARLTATAPDARTDLDRLMLLDIRAQLRLAQQRPDEALDDCLQAGQLADAADGRLRAAVRWRSTAALAYMALDQRPLAEPLIEVELGLARRCNSLRSVLRALRVQGLLASDRRRLDLLAEAAWCGAGWPTRLEYLHALVDYGAALHRAHRRAAARPPLYTALELCRQAGAAALAARAAEELTAAGGRALREPATPAELTPGERRVADLAARGLTTRQIAAVLFVTPKTVEFHLRHIYGKLGIPSSRDALTAALRPSAAARSAFAGA